MNDFDYYMQNVHRRVAGSGGVYTAGSRSVHKEDGLLVLMDGEHVRCDHYLDNGMAESFLAEVYLRTGECTLR